MNVLIVALLLVCACNTKDSKESQESFLYGDTWKRGKDVFYGNCSQCHVPRNKDEIFADFLKRGKALDANDRAVRFRRILNDTNHTDKGISLLDEQQFQELLLFIETPQKKGVID